MTICAYCYFGIFGVKCLTPAKIISYGKQHFWLQSFALVLQFGMQHLKSFSTIWIWWKLLLETDYQITIETPFYKFTSVEYQCKLSVMSILISAFSTGITQRIVVKSKKNCKAYKKEGEKEKDYILKLVTFLHLQVITPCQKVNK